VKKRGTCAFLALALTAGVAYAQNVTIDSDLSAPFAAYRTYVWVPGWPAPSSLTEERIHAEVDAQFKAKGLTLINSSDADLSVASFVVIKKFEQSGIASEKYAPWWIGGGLAAVPIIPTYFKGTLILDLFDRARNHGVWHGVATDTDCNKPLRNIKKVDKAITQLFGQYPPTASLVR
jgi:hypothetical protein